MRFHLPRGFLAAAAALALAISGCASVRASHIQGVGSPAFPPSDPSQIELLHAPPTRPHVRLGEVRAEPTSDSVEVGEIEQAMRKEAAALGADALVVVHDRTQITGAVVTGPWWGRSLQPIEGRVVIAVAIKYR